MLDFPLSAKHKPPSARFSSANLRHQRNCPAGVSVQSNHCSRVSIQLSKFSGMKVCKACALSNLGSFCCHLDRSRRSPLHISARDVGFHHSYCPRAVDVLDFKTAHSVAAGGSLLMSWFNWSHLVALVLCSRVWLGLALQPKKPGSSSSRASQSDHRLLDSSLQLPLV